MLQSMGWQRARHDLATEQQRSEGCFAKPLSMWLFPALFWGSRGQDGQEVCSQGLCSGALLFFLDCWAPPEDRPVSCPYAHMCQPEPVCLLSSESLQKLHAVPTSLSRAPLLMITLWRGGPLLVLGNGPCCQQQRPVPFRPDRPTAEPNFFHPSPLRRPHFYILSR